MWLQEQLSGDGGRPWWTLFTGLVYTSHFLLPWLIAAILYVLSRERWSRYMRRILLLSYLGLVTYILLPAAPPWYAARAGVIQAEIHRATGFGFRLYSVDIGADWLAAHSNPVAAIPSLHAAFALLIAIALWPSARRRWWRLPLAAFPLAMGFTLVYGGEHYVIDVLLGWVYVGLAIGLARVWERRRAPATPVSAPAAAPPDG